MYVDHSIIKCNYSDDTKIWKYLDLWKFISILENKALYFARCDLLGDPFEGSISEKAWLDFYNFSLYARRDLLENTSVVEKKEIISRTMDSIKQITNFTINYGPKMYCVNCWHANDNESYAFWNIYTNKNDGIAIQSTIGKIKYSTRDNPETMFIGDVNYIDYSTQSTGFAGLEQFFTKCIEYKYENEVRLLICNKTSKNNPDKIVHPYDKDFDPPAGLYLSLDLDSLIESIYISPYFEDWKTDVLEKLLDNYDIKKKPIKSKLSQKPFNPEGKII